METQKNVAGIVMIAFVIGLGIGYFVSLSVPKQTFTHEGMMDISQTMGGMIGGLSGKTGDDFDKVFLSEMILHHEGAVSMAQLALQNAKHHEIVLMAQDIISAQTREIGQMKDWQQAWYGQN